MKTTNKGWVTFVKRLYFASVCTDRILLLTLQIYVQELFFSDQSIILIHQNKSFEFRLVIFISPPSKKKSWTENSVLFSNCAVFCRPLYISNTVCNRSINTLLVYDNIYTVYLQNKTAREGDRNNYKHAQIATCTPSIIIKHHTTLTRYTKRSRIEFRKVFSILVSPAQ